MTTTPPRPIADLDVPLSTLAADVQQLVARQRACLTLADAAGHSHSPSDRIAYALDAWWISHPEAGLSTDATYPGWAEYIAAREAANRTRQEAS